MCPLIRLIYFYKCDLPETSLSSHCTDSIPRLRIRVD